MANAMDAAFVALGNMGYTGTLNDRLAAFWAAGGGGGGTGAAGASYISGTGVPSAGTGNNGDSYLNLTNGDVYQKSAGAWVGPQGNLKGVAGATGATGPAGSGSRVTVQSSTAPSSIVTGTGTVGNAPMAAATIPAGAAAANGGSLIFSGLVKMTNSANAKGLQFYYGGTLVVPTFQTINTDYAQFECTVQNTGVATAQNTTAYAKIKTGVASSSITASTINSAVSQNLTIYSELTTSGETMQVINWKVESLN